MTKAKNPRARGLGSLTVTFSRSDLASVALIAGLISAWTAVAGGAFSLMTLLACLAMFLTFYGVGSVFAAWKPLAENVLFDLPLRLLVGYAVVNTTLLILAVVSPFSILVNGALVLAVVLLVLTRTKKRQEVAGSATSLIVVGLCSIATTLWCQDLIDPILPGEKLTLFKPWVDSFYHAVHIRTFAESHGASSIEDFRMAGVPARLYHYGMYMLPAFIKQAAGIHSYTAFASILAPVGVLFTGLAAYAFVGSVWGAWPGIAAAAALLLLPDGAQQGMQNPFMSYHWLTHISPSATYGLALLAVAWLFVIQGCLKGNRLQLLAGWAVAGILVIYKLHYVIASALLLLLIPALFFRAQLSPKRRALWVAGAFGFYVAALAIGQQVPGVPMIRYDGSSNGEVLRLILSFAAPGALKQTLVERMGPTFPWTANLAFGLPYVVLTILGALLPALALLVFGLRRRSSLLLLVFPGLLILNFLAMFFGLALDMKSSTPDELSHRPLMIVYFFVASWVGGALGLLLLESQTLGRFARPALVIAMALLMLVPVRLGPGIQLMWAMPKISPVRLPTDLIRVAEHVRTHGGPEDIFQDSQFDRFYAVSALAERRSFVSHPLTRMPFRAKMVATRSDAVDRLMLMKRTNMVVGTTGAFGIKWFVLHPGNRVQWPSALADYPVFTAGQFKLYKF